MLQSVLIVAGSFGMGILGGLLGVGGGVFLVPFLALAAGLRPVEAVGVSLCCIIGTGAASSLATLRQEANLPLALLLEPFLVVGAALASLFAQRLSDRTLLLGFSGLIVFVAVLFTLRGRAHSGGRDLPKELAGAPGPFDGVSLGTAYRARRPAALGLLALLAGVASGLFGVGGGVLVIPLLVFVGGLPLRAAASTSAVCLMTTAAAGAAVHVAHASVPPAVVALSLVGVLPGGLLGARLQPRISERALRTAFVTLAIATAILTVRRALAGGGP